MEPNRPYWYDDDADAGRCTRDQVGKLINPEPEVIEILDVEESAPKVHPKGAKK